MRRYIILMATLSLLLFSVVGTSAQTETTPPTDNHTAREEAEGKDIWEKLQNKQTSCDNLSDSDFGVLGEYFMGQMIGSSHETMNTMMEKMMGKEGEEQMHIVMGKRNSGCDTSAVFPQKGVGFIPMIGSGFGNMMGGWGGFGFLGFLTWIFWVVVLVDLILLGILLWKKIKKEK